jgi:hypothetical protein
LAVGFLENFVGGFGPDERVGVLVPAGDEVLDGSQAKYSLPSSVGISG